MPPDAASYDSVAARRRRAGRKPFPRPEAQRAAEGLSVIDGLEHAREHAQMNPHLGSVLVRYHIPDGIDYRAEHIVGPPYHLTLFLVPLTRLADFLDATWWEALPLP